jgi:hypothetical protein
MTVQHVSWINSKVLRIGWRLLTLSLIWAHGMKSALSKEPNCVGSSPPLHLRIDTEVQSLRTALSNGPNWAGASPYFYLTTKDPVFRQCFVQNTRWLPNFRILCTCSGPWQCMKVNSHSPPASPREAPIGQETGCNPSNILDMTTEVTFPLSGNHFGWSSSQQVTLLRYPDDTYAYHFTISQHPVALRHHCKL